MAIPITRKRPNIQYLELEPAKPPHRYAVSDGSTNIAVVSLTGEITPTPGHVLSADDVSRIAGLAGWVRENEPVMWRTKGES